MRTCSVCGEEVPEKRDFGHILSVGQQSWVKAHHGDVEVRAHEKESGYMCMPFLPNAVPEPGVNDDET